MSLFGEKDTKIGAEFTFGVQSLKKIEGGYMLAGRVDGTVRPGVEVYVTNPGVGNEIALAKVEELHMPSGAVSVTSDCMCGIGLSDVEGIEIRTGTVLYTKK